MNIATNLNDLVSITDLARSASKLVGKLLSGESERMVVLKNNKPAAVILSPELYQQLLQAVEELETLQDIHNATLRAQASRENDLSLEQLAEKLDVS